MDIYYTINRIASWSHPGIVDYLNLCSKMRHYRSDTKYLLTNFEQHGEDAAEKK